MATSFDPSIYNIQQTINDIAKMYVPNENEDTLSLGLFGYIADISALQIQNDIILNSELGNELWPSRAKYEKNVITHSIIQNITNINAKPATIPVYIGFEEEKLKSLFVNDLFTVDKDYVFRIGKFEFHLEYDLIIQRSVVINRKYIYSARYDISRKNVLSDITNPYTSTPYFQIDQSKRMVYVPCRLMQVSHKTEYRKIITSSSIDNKTFEFSFDDQLAAFEVAVIENGETTYLTPIFDGSPIENDVIKHCFYTYIDAHTIRVRFDSLSYLPTLNADIEVYVKTTKGAEGNFEFDEILRLALSSDRFEYKNFSITMETGLKSTGGEDRKTVEELRRLLPKEALSRGSITTVKDLQNFFNTMILDSSKLRIEIMKKISNDFVKRSYYAYMVMKDEYDNVIPANTINIEVPKSLFDTHDNRKYVLKPGCYIVYENDVGHIYNKNDEALQTLIDDDTENLIYTVPFTLVVTADPLYVSYYLTIMNTPSYLTFTYINQEIPVQFISTVVGWTRKFLTDSDYYFLDIDLRQNMEDGGELFEYDDNDNIIEETARLRVVMVMYNEGVKDPYRYAYGKIMGMDKDGKYRVRFAFRTSDKINDDNNIRIEKGDIGTLENLYIPGTSSQDYGYFTSHINANIYVLYKSPEEQEKDYGRYDLNGIIPEDDIKIKGFSVSNMYTINDGLNFYYNYSQIMSSTVTDRFIEDEFDGENGFLIKSVPVIKHSYMNNEHNVQALLNQFNYEKAYIDHAMQLLENNFLIDFKLFNTYGKSTLYYTDMEGTKLLNRVHLSLDFELKLLKTSDNNTKNYILQDIKQMIEDLNDLSSLHIPNLITKITNTYRNSIEFIEFKGFNIPTYGSGDQHLYRHENDDVSAVPEFLCINVNEDMEPDIKIKLV